MYYKFINNDKTAVHAIGFSFADYLPSGRRPGKWLPEIADLQMCKSGYHVADASQLADWLTCGTLYVAEVRGGALHESDKSAHQQMRLTRKLGTVTPEITVQLANWSANYAKEVVAAIPAANAPEYAEYAAYAARYAKYAARYAARYAQSAARHAAAYAPEYAAYAKYAAESAESAARHAEYAESAARHAKYAESAARHAESAESAAAKTFNEAWTAELVRILEVVQ